VSQENVELLRNAFQAFTTEGSVAVAAYLAPDIEWDTSARGSDGGVAHGIEAVIRVTDEWVAAWKDVRVELSQIRGAGDQFAVHFRQRAKGTYSGIEGDLDWFASVSVARGKITTYREHPTWTEALKAVGLEE
jgi:ketosteroid isomerase-like protein